jgi:hypothetical protein
MPARVNSSRMGISMVSGYMKNLLEKMCLRARCHDSIALDVRSDAPDAAICR